MNWLNKIFKLKNPLQAKIVICFNIQGCMAHIYNFESIGYVTKEYKSDSGVDMYELEIIKKDECGDIRDGQIGTKTVWQIQKLIFNLYAFYN